MILSNLENINAELIEMGLSQSERLIRLNDMAKKQMELLRKNKSLKSLEYIENKVDDKDCKKNYANDNLLIGNQKRDLRTNIVS